MDTDIIKEIIDDLSEIKINEYKRTNFKPSNKIIFIKKRKNVNKETIDLKNFKSKVSSTVYKYNQKNRNNNVIDFGNDLNDSKNNIFNFINDNTKQITWRQLSIDEKIEKIKKFFTYENIKENKLYDSDKYCKELIAEILDLTSSKKIIYKKQVNYDQINNRIISLPCVKFFEKENCYKYYIEEKKKKRKTAKQMFK